jgi:uncharacterized membrane protein
LWSEISVMDVSRSERNMAALAQSLGILAALPVWLRWRNHSTFVRAHAAQSIAFDGVTLAALVIVATLTLGVAVGGYAALSTLPGSGKDLALLFLVAVCAPGMALIGFLVVMAAALGLRLRAAMAASQGQPFHYPLLTKKTSEVSKTSEV